MARPDKVLAMFRGIAAAALTGQFGTTAVPELICVKPDSNGELVAAGQGEAEGVVFAPEGKAAATVASYNVMPANAKATVFVMAEFTDDLGTLAAGDSLWSAASGGIVTADPGGISQKIGTVYANDQGDLRLFINVPMPASISSDIEQTVINGGSAGAHTVTGIATADSLISVIYTAAAAASKSDLTSEFTISAANTIDNTAGTDTTSGFLLVTYARAI